uniref:Hedgehog acyltransferase n=1 Tax=Sus scrofa TaxID=9823 RepID=A0A5G2Q9V7_PIG
FFEVYHRCKYLPLTCLSVSPSNRYFDVGLHDFLVRYVYIPVGGSQHGLLGTLFSTAVTFAFVSYWHGGNDYLWCWAALNWLGVTVESGVRRLVQKPSIQDSLAQVLSPQARRRFHAALASCSTSMLILSNLVFLGGNQVGKSTGIGSSFKWVCCRGLGEAGIGLCMLWDL